MQYIKRQIDQKILETVTKFPKEIIVIAGARQVGKTTLLTRIMQQLRSKKINYLYFNLDVEEDLNFLATQQRFLSALDFNFGGKQAIIFIDEIQRKKNAGIFLKGLYDLNLPYTFVVTGSGSIDIKASIGESLMGRKKVFILHPLDFVEYFNYRTDYQYTEKIWEYLSTFPEQGLNLLIEYLNTSGYPKVQLLKDLNEKRNYLQEIFKSYILRDLSILLNIHKPEVFEKLLFLLADYEGKIFRLSGLAKDLGVRRETVDKYLWYAQQTYLIYKITGFYGNKAKELRKPLSVYFEDHGFSAFLRSEFAFSLEREKLGFQFQSMIFRVLRQFADKENYMLNYWRTSDGAEVDFVLNNVKTIIPVEVKFSNLKKPVATRSLYAFIEKYHPKKAYLINLNLDKTVVVDKTEIHFITWYNFLKEFYIEP